MAFADRFPTVADALNYVRVVHAPEPQLRLQHTKKNVIIKIDEEKINFDGIDFSAVTVDYEESKLVANVDYIAIDRFVIRGTGGAPFYGLTQAGEAIFQDVLAQVYIGLPGELQFRGHFQLV